MLFQLQKYTNAWVIQGQPTIFKISEDKSEISNKNKGSYTEKMVPLVRRIGFSFHTSPGN
jgi:hypothetical protein